MISRAKKYVAVLLVFVCVCMIFSPLTAYAAEDSSQHETVKVGFFAMDGYMTTREIRTLRNNRKANIPIVAMTANAFEEDKKNQYLLFLTRCLVYRSCCFSIGAYVSSKKTGG